MPSETAPRAAPHTPDPRHARRIPVHLDRGQFNRIKQAVHVLPQVVRPGDYERAEDGEAHLDRLGLVMLQKAAAGARPSRWIDPALMDSALAHLDAVGTGPEVRTLMLERAAALESLGIIRRDGAWTRRVRQTLVLGRPEWALPVAYRVPLDAAAVWHYYRSGDMPALLAALGDPPPYPDAGQVRAHLVALVERSHAYRPEHLASLLARLQAECATPQPPADLLAACDRALERWERQIDQIEMLAHLTNELAFSGYPDTFQKARQLQRQVTLYVGPPNSGKTHAAFERLTQALDGAYLAPLRLLALEGRDRLVARGVPTSLLTGEENVPVPDERVVSSTIEMVATNTVIDVAVIDEAQMIFDASRGWAWTQAIVAVPAREVIVICSSFAVPAIENLLGLCGERCTIRHFERKQHVGLLPRPVGLADLRLGDAVVAFSRREVLQLRDQIGALGHPVSVVYGALPPEVRRREAERYAQGESHVLVATDAIGMGLNLPIRRVLFSTLVKYDGQVDRPLDTSEVHQIAGRAGRYGMHEEGHAGVLEGAEPDALVQLAELLHDSPRAPAAFKAPVAPNGWHIETISTRLGKTGLREVLDVFVDQLRLDDAHFAVAELDQMLELAAQLDAVASSLALKQRFVYAQAPVDLRTDTLVQAYLGWAAGHARVGSAGTPWFLEEVDGHSRLDRMEQALRACTLWLWLDLRFPGVYGHLDAVQGLREELNDGIERQLKGKRPLAMVRRGRGPESNPRQPRRHP